MGLHGHTRQGAQGLALATCGDDDGLRGRQSVQVAELDLQARRDLQVFQLLGNPGVGHHGFAVEQYLAPEFGGDVDDLLHPVDVGSEDRHDHPARGLADEAFQGDVDLALGKGGARAFGIGGVRHEG